MKDRIINFYRLIVVLLFVAWLLVFISWIKATAERNDARRELQEAKLQQTSVVVDAMPEIDKPEYHIEATEPPQPEPFDSNALEWDYSYVMRVVGAECRGEPADGIKAVCEVIANRSEMYGMTPEEVVKQEGQFAEPMPSEFYDGGELVNEMCLLTFACGERWFEEPIMAFCSTGCNSAWHNSLRYVCTIGGHNFYARWE